MNSSIPVAEDTLKTPVQFLKGIGPKRAAVLQSNGIETVRDLIYYFPRKYLDRSTIVPFRQMTDYNNQIVTGIGTVVSVIIPKGRKKRLVVTLNDVRGVLECVFFQGVDYWAKAFEVGEVLAVSGKVNFYGPKPSIVHPVIDRLENEQSMEFINTGGIIPVYPSNAELENVGLTRHGGFRKIIRHTVRKHAHEIKEYLPASVIDRYKFISLSKALNEIHFPHSKESLSDAQRRLKFDELFLFQLQLLLQRKLHIDSAPGISFAIESAYARSLLRALPFELTHAQKKVIKEITNDMRAATPMNRLLQGDVGSGKTVVALLAALVAVENGYQVALMVPTEILAEQHYRTIMRLLESSDDLDNFRIRIELLLGAHLLTHKTRVLENIANGNVDIVVGTHALIQKKVSFHKLGLIIIDEQHRFGVLQRAEIRGKAARDPDNAVPDLLVMTATPIPRTLAMTLFGDLDVSVIDEMPKNRKPVKTYLRFEEDRAKLYAFMKDQVKMQRQIYIVFPLVEESEKLDLKAASEEYEKFRTGIFTDLRIGLLHGKMDALEKDEIMMKFKEGKIDILVTTIVIEVGIDVPNATVMIVEHAERFGLSQLHQLRGRVGRGADQSYCILMTTKKFFYGGREVNDETKELISMTRKRLQTMCATSDGFVISEVDLEIRGPGDFWGTKQHGFPELRIANLLTDSEIVQTARHEAQEILLHDPQLRKHEHFDVRTIVEGDLRNKVLLGTVA